MSMYSSMRRSIEHMLKKIGEPFEIERDGESCGQVIGALNRKDTYITFLPDAVVEPGDWLKRIISNEYLHVARVDPVVVEGKIARIKVFYLAELEHQAYSQDHGAIALEQYSLAAIRGLLRNAFTSKELWRFLQTRPVLTPILHRINREDPLEDMIDGVTQYCQKQGLFDELLTEINKENPKQYERYRSQLFRSDVSS